MQTFACLKTYEPDMESYLEKKRIVKKIVL